MDLLTIQGNAYSIAILDQAGVADADLLIAVTSSETANLTIATIGKQLGAKKTIARVNSSEFLKLKDRLDLSGMGIDVIISPEELASKEIVRLLRRSSFSNAFDFEFGKLTLLGVYLTEKSKILKMSYDNLNQCFKEYPELERSYRMILEKYYIVLEEHQIFSKFKSAKERYMELMENRPKVIQKASVGQIASYLDMTIETLSRTRAKI